MNQMIVKMGMNTKIYLLHQKTKNPFEWEEETIHALHAELEKSDSMICALVEEIEELRKKVKNE
ncbi:hypothetical protein ACNRWW_10460 [Metabacillus sp. HB246100]